MLSKLLFLICATGTVIGQNIFPPLPITAQTSENVLCRRDSIEYIDNLKQLTLWAHEMRDATAKSTTSVLRGSHFNMGNFEQCLTARAPFPTQYCLVKLVVKVPEPKSDRSPFSIYYEPSDTVLTKLYKYEDVSRQARNVVKLGWCTPATCTPLELEQYLNEYLNNFSHPFKQNVTYFSEIPEAYCQISNEKKVMDYVDIAFCTLALTLILLVIISTFWDYNINYEKKTKVSLVLKLLMAFSARKNFSDLSKHEGSDKSLSILYGIKTFSIFMIIIDHRFAFFIGSAVINFDYIEEMYRNPLVSYIFHGDLFVDTFFVISGILVVYSLMSVFEKKFVNPGLIIFMRYMRLTPAYAFVVFFYSTVFYYSGHGPLWNAAVGAEVKDCRQNWWANLLYINTYVNSEHMCMVHSWYLPCDFHFFIVALCLVLLIKKERRCGLVVYFFLAIISVIVPFTIRLVYQRLAFLRFYPEEINNPKVDRDFILTYTKSHARASPYFIGMFAGYVYYKMKGSENKLSKCYSTILVLISTFLLLTCMFAGSIYYDPFHPYNALESATYGALHRAVWALGTFGMMYAISYGTLGFLHKCLSWTCWIPLSKLVYGAYLTHYSFQIRAAYNTINPMEFSFFDVITYGLSDIVLAFLFALGLYLAVEAPVRKILKALLLPSKSENKKPKEEVDSHEMREENNSSRL